LSNQISRDEIRASSVVGDDHYLTRACDRIDIHFAENVFLCQCHKQVARADDLIDLAHALDPVGKCRNGLRPAQPVHLGDA